MSAEDLEPDQSPEAEPASDEVPREWVVLEQSADGPGATPGVTRLTLLYRGLLGRPSGLLLALACATIVIYGMRNARSILAPILLAMFVVMGLSPVLQWLRRKGMPAWAAIVIVIVGFFVVAGALVAGIAASLGQINTKIPVYTQNLSQIYADLQAWFAERGIDISGLTDNILRPDRIMGWITSTVSLLISLLTNAFLLLLIVAFMVAEVYSFPRKIYHQVHLGPNLSRAFHNFADVTRTFLFTLTWLNMLTAVLVAVVYYAFGVDFALLWTLLFFLLSFIPNIGFVLSVIPPFFVTLLESGFARAAIVVAIVILFNGFVNNAIAPRFMGQKTGLSTLAVFLSLVLWAWILGPIGALMSVPLMLMVKLLFLEAYDSTRSISALISPTPGSRKKAGGDGPADAVGEARAG
jgi:predicted PurR-regulated permease PerM